MNIGGIDIEALPTTLTASEIADLYGLGVDHVYAEVREGRWPSPVLRIGRSLRFPTLPALELLGLAPKAEESIVE